MSRNETSRASRACLPAATSDCYTGAVREVGQHTGLQRRGARYFLRVRVPEALRPIIGKREVTKALGTSEGRVAVERLHRARVEVDELFKAASRTLAKDEGPAMGPEPSHEAIVSAVQGWLAAAERSALASAIPDEQAEVVLESVREEAAHFGAPGAEHDASAQALGREIVRAAGY